MKKVLLGLAAASLTVISIIGCGILPTNADKADITLGLSAQTVPAGNSLNITGNVDASSEPTITYAIEAVTAANTDGVSASGTAVSGKNKVDFANDAAAKVITTSTACNGTYALVVTAKAGSAESTKRDTFTVTGGATCTAATLTQSTVTLGGHSNATLGSSVDLDDPSGTALLAAAAVAAGAAVDILYTYSSVLSSPVLMSPAYARDNSGITAFSSWPNASSTQFHKVSASYASITTAAAIQALFDPAMATSGRVACAAGDVFVVKTNEGNYVLLQMVSVSTDASGTANIKYAQ